MKYDSVYSVPGNNLSRKNIIYLARACSFSPPTVFKISLKSLTADSQANNSFPAKYSICGCLNQLEKLCTIMKHKLINDNYITLNWSIIMIYN